MPNYVKKALKQFQHKVRKLQNAPYPSVPIQYGAKKQYATQKSSTASGCQNQEIYPANMRQVFIPGTSSRQHTTFPISAIASQLSAPTTDTLKYTMQLFDSLGSQEDAVLSYHASDMIVAVHSDASYLSQEPGARSRAGGHFFLSSDTPVPLFGQY
jgi:hypothetical protein